MKLQSSFLAFMAYAVTVAAAMPAIAADDDAVGRFLGLYRASSNAADPALPAPAVLRRGLVALSLERDDGDIVVRLVGTGYDELVYRDSESRFHLIANTAGPDIASVSGFLRIEGDQAVAQRSEIGVDGQQRHLRLLMRREGANLRLTVLASDGTKPLALVSDRRLRALPGK
jgi:hypothetical protein